MSSYIKFTENDMRLAKQADLIQYMLAEHPERVFYRTGTLRDCNHNSLVIYHDSYFRYSLHEAGCFEQYAGRCFERGKGIRAAVG